MSNLINRLKKLVLKMLSIDEDRNEPLVLLPRTFSFQDGVGGFYFLNYKTHRVLLISLKYSEERSVARILRPLYKALSELHTSEATVEERMYLIPLPQSKLRVIKRGFNQVRRLLSEMMRLDTKKLFYFETNNLVKVHETKKQALLSRTERLVAQKDAFKVRNSEKLRGKTVLLFDDIVTTGASLAEARKTLLQAGVKEVICVALAH